MNIGYIGLGLMGKPAALNLLRAGFNVGVWARRPDAVLPLAEAGATAYAAPAQLAAAVDVLITNVSDTADVQQVLFGAGEAEGEAEGKGASAGLRAGSVVIDMSTIAPTTAAEIAARLAERDVAFLDAPVSGGVKGAIEGTLTFMVGGAAAAFERMQPVFAAMGETVTHIGAAGAGQVAKACNQIIIGATLSGVAEAFRLAEASGTDAARVRQALLGGYAASRVLEIHAQRMLSGDFTPGFKAVLHRKDIAIALAEAKANHLPLPSAELFFRRLQQLIDSGDGELDSAAVCKILSDETD